MYSFASLQLVSFPICLLGTLPFIVNDFFKKRSRQDVACMHFLPTSYGQSVRQLLINLFLACEKRIPGREQRGLLLEQFERGGRNVLLVDYEAE